MKSAVKARRRFALHAVQYLLKENAQENALDNAKVSAPQQPIDLSTFKSAKLDDIWFN